MKEQTLITKTQTNFNFADKLKVLFYPDGEGVAGDMDDIELMAEKILTVVEKQERS